MSGCPARSVLRAYEGGRLDEAEAEPVERHVATCQTCRADMDRIRATHPEARALRTAYLESQSGSTAFEPDVVAGRPTPGAAAQGGDTARRGGSTRGGPRTDGGVPRPVDDADWVVPDYERVLLCGEGSYGSVWAVRDRVGVYRALKIIDMARMSSAKVGCRESTALEAYCRKVSRHPALITVYHVGMIGNTLYYTMELADDESTRLPAHAEFPKYYRPLTLASVVTRRRVAPDVAVDIARRLLQGLARMHDLDLIHRDIKPGNIVWVNRRPKLADIGMVIPLSESGATIGTPRYMPPDKVMDRTADTYAMGKVLHEMIAGMSPTTFPTLPDSVRHGGTRWDLDRVSSVLERACTARADDRYQHASDMLDDLESAGDASFASLFDDVRRTDAPRTRDQAAIEARIALAALRAIPWIVGLLGLVLILRWLT